MTNTPDYRITIIGESGEIVITGLKDDTRYPGNYKTDPKMRDYCTALSLRSDMQKFNREKKRYPSF